MDKRTEIMGADKRGTKGGGFFNLFEWNRKPRKRLFASVSPEGARQGSKSDFSSADSSHKSNDSNEIGGITVVKESGDNSCVSSVTDEDGNSIRAPGVVARLMGLDSLPTTSVSDSVSTPLLEPQSFHENHYQYKSPGFDVNNPLTIGLIRTEAYARKPPELKRQKMPSSPIERFQREILPSRSRSAKSLPYTYHKLPSPVKNPRFISMEDAAQIMEAAVKILEPRVDPNYNTRASVLGSCSHSHTFRETKEHVEPFKTTSTSLASSRKPAESMTVKNLKGQIVQKSHSCDGYSYSPLSLSDIPETNPMGTKDKGKSISLAIQAKVNLQRRGSMSTSGKNSPIQKDLDGSKQQQPFRNQANSQQNKLQKRVSVPSYSGVLKQNNQKQNCSAGKDKVPSKSPVANQQAKEGVSGRNNSNKILGCSKNGCCREGSDTVRADKEKPSSRIINLPRKETSACKSFHSEKTEYTTTIVVDRLGKNLQSDAFSNEQSKWKKNGERNSMDVISFTFNTPIVKPITGNQFSVKLNDKEVKGDDPNVRDQGKSNAEVTKHESVSSPGLNFINGDDLSILLERKLRELSLQLESAPSSKVDDSCTTSVSTLKDLPSTYEISAAAPEEPYKDVWGKLDEDNHDNGSASECSMDDGDYWRRKLQASESLKKCHNKTIARMQLHVKNPNPLSILEASFPDEVSFSDLSIRGRELYSLQKDDTSGPSLAMNFPLVDAVRELSGSASLASKLTVNESQLQNFEVEYVGEILSTAGWNSGYSCNVACGRLDPLIFHQLENKANWSPDNHELCKLKRKVLFDCVGECLDLKRRCYFTSGYRTWSKGVLLIRKSDFAEKIHKEISAWSCMESLELDEIVDKDMTSYLGRWLDFETEAFQTGIEIEGKILNRLLDEIIHEFLT